jgi:hypothetical protein
MTMGFIIKSFHSPGAGAPSRAFFWQTPWAVYDRDLAAYREVGGWQTFSGNATTYDSQEEAENVNAIRALGGRVDLKRA